MSTYPQLKIGNPLDTTNHVGPLIDKDAMSNYLTAIASAQQQGGRVLVESGSWSEPSMRVVAI